MLRQLRVDAVDVGARQVDLVQRHDDGDARRLAVVDRFDRLGHDPVVGRHHQDHDIRHVGAAGTHGRERFVARRVQERHGLVVPAHLVGAHVLGDAAGLARGDVRLADAVQQTRFAVVDVAQHGRDDRPPLEVGPLSLIEFLLDLFFHRCLAFDDQFRIELQGHQFRHLAGDGLVGGGHDPLLHEFADDVGGLDRQGGRQVLHQNRLADDNSLGSGRSDVLLGALGRNSSGRTKTQALSTGGRRRACLSSISR